MGCSQPDSSLPALPCLLPAQSHFQRVLLALKSLKGTFQGLTSPAPAEAIPIESLLVMARLWLPPPVAHLGKGDFSSKLLSRAGIVQQAESRSCSSVPELCSCTAGRAQPQHKAPRWVRACLWAIPHLSSSAAASRALQEGILPRLCSVKL